MGRAVVFVLALLLGAETASADDRADCEQTRDWDLRIEACTKLIARDPDDAAAYANRCGAYNEHEYFRRAIAECRGDLDDELEEELERAHAADPDHAIADCTKAIALNPDAVEAYKDRGEAHHQKEDLDEAIADFTKAIELDPKFVPAYVGRGHAYMKKSMRVSAEARRGRMIGNEELKRAWPGAYMTGGRAFNTNEAPKRNAKEPDKDTDRTVVDRKELAKKSKTYVNLAFADFKKVIELESGWGFADPIGGPLFLIKPETSFNPSIAGCTKAVQLDPTSDRAYARRGWFYSFQGQHDRAIADYSKAITLNPTHASHYDGRGQAFRKSGQFDRAIADYTKAIELDPKDPRAYDNRGAVYRKQDQFEKARTDFAKAKELRSQR